MVFVIVNNYVGGGVDHNHLHGGYDDHDDDDGSGDDGIFITMRPTLSITIDNKYVLNAS